MYLDTSRAYVYNWSPAPKDREVVLLIVSRSNREHYLLNSYNHHCKTYQTAQSFYNNRYGSSYSAVYLLRDDYNERIANGTFEQITYEELKELHNRCANQQGKSMKALPPAMKNQPAHLVWNASTCALVQACETEAQAVEVAQNMARENPTHIFFVNNPSKKIFQPVNITVESVTLVPEGVEVAE